MQIRRTLPPAAAPIAIMDLLHGLAGFLSSTKYLRRLENEVRERFGTRHVFFVSSGKAALTLILRALKSVSSGKHKVLIPAYTCYSVPSAIVKAGLQVSLCDIDPGTLDFNSRLLDDAITEDTLCVIPDHLFGVPADLDRITGLCKRKGVFVLEDAAQAMGGTYRGRPLGTIGDVGFFSLGRGKNITCGSGGIIVTGSHSIADAIRKEYSLLKEPGMSEVIREFVKAALLGIFIHPSLYWLPSGLPHLRLGETIFYKDFPMKKLSGMHAGLLRGFRERLQAANEIRKENAAWFRNELKLPQVQDGRLPFLRLPVAVKNREMREKILSLSREKGLGISPLYPAPINEIAEIRDQFSGAEYPVAKEIAESLITLPTHHLLSKKDKERICRHLNGQDEAFSLQRAIA